MPKRHSKAEQRKRLKVEAKQQRISVSELKKRLKSDGDGDNPELPPEDNIIVSTSNVFTTDSMLCPVEEHLATAGAVTTVEEHFGWAAPEAEGENSLSTVEEQLEHVYTSQDAVAHEEGDAESAVTTAEH
jgi:hypothetical protein